MLDPLGCIVGCANVNNSEVINSVHGLIRLVRGAKTAFVLVEYEMSSFPAVGQLGNV